MFFIRFVFLLAFVVSCGAEVPPHSVNAPANPKFPEKPPERLEFVDSLMAETCSEKSSTRTIEIVGNTVVEQLFVHPEKITRLIFPSDIQTAKANEQALFRITATRLVEKDPETPIRQVAIMPKPDAKSTILYVSTDTFEAILDVTVVGEDVPTQRFVHFTPISDEQRIKHRVMARLSTHLRQIRATQERYEKLFAEFQRLSEARALDLVAYALWQDVVGPGRADWCRVRSRAVAPDAKLRAGWVRWIGEYLFIAFSVRSFSDELEVVQVTLANADGERPMGVSLRDPDMWSVNADPKGHLVVAVLPAAAAYAGAEAELRISAREEPITLPLAIPELSCQADR